MNAPALDDRGQALRTLALGCFGAAALHSARAPGRVNLIGDHIDYCDLPVLPMAIQRDVRIDFTPRADGVVRIANTNPRFEPARFELSSRIAAAQQGHWSNYVRAAGQHFSTACALGHGFDAVVDGNIPVAAGLSSSSALLVASALALLRSNGLDIPRAELARQCALAERYVGTNSGGMDQAVSLLAREGCALRIDFAPLAGTPIRMPAHWRFVIADSLVLADKSGSLRESYNARRRSSEQALDELRAHAPRSGSFANYRELIARHGTQESLALGARTLSGQLLRRFCHIISEAERVERACVAMQAEDGAGFGRLMDESQRSLREDCEVSLPQIETLIACAKRHGALGARISGAGLGGVIVALIEESRAEALLQGLAEDYFAERIPARELRAHLLLAKSAAAAE
jgi:galactokinase